MLDGTFDTADRQAIAPPPVLLPWDSAVFGFDVARVQASRVSEDLVDRLAAALRGTSVRLVYLDCDHDADPTYDAMRHPEVFNAGQNVTFMRDLTSAVWPKNSERSMLIEPYIAPLPSPQLLELALRSGIQSRFRNDARMPRGVFDEIYRRWLTSSLEDQAHCTTLVATHDATLRGFAIAKQSQDMGVVSLIAVSPESEGRGLGRALVAACERRFIAASNKHAKIVTQAANTAACALYTKMGYAIAARRYLYHWWNPAARHRPEL